MPEIENLILFPSLSRQKQNTKARYQLGTASMIEFIAESDPLVAKVKPEMVINHAILKKPDDGGFFEQLVKR